jgi:hypothetical protein
MSEELLNDNWLINFEKTDKLYEDFYKDDVYYTNITFIYINKDNEIEKISEESFLLSKPNFILREEIIGMLKKTLCDNQRKYTLFSILKYNITLAPENIRDYLFYSHNENDNDNYLTIIKNIDTIFFEKTINTFQDLNDVFFIFCEKQKPNNILCEHSKTKRVYINDTNSNNNQRKKQTRRAY